ncbi:portal protein [Parabacteroides provencensis]|uniref:portal protein n=1 Tax=Parabacteroides provencensis TaxID=1944636 RepID=UPI000C15CCEF|nr:hypothetical protein [Parabacteroides provencensis]
MGNSVNLKMYNHLFKKKGKIDSVLEEDIFFSKNNSILLEAYNAWESLRNFRKEAERCSMYVYGAERCSMNVYGDQWGDKIDTKEGTIKESTYIKKQGKVPLKNNRVRPLVRTVLGQFSSSQTEPVCVARDRDEQKIGEMMSATIQYGYQKNKLWELDRRNLETFLIAGAAFFRTYYGWNDEYGMMDVWTDSVNYNRIFLDTHMEDYRHWDCSLIGEIHDISLNEILSKFADGSKDKALYLKNIYRSHSREDISNIVENLQARHFTEMDFFIPDDIARCRVIEIWRKESKERIRVHDRLTGEWYKVEIEEEENLKKINQQRIQEQIEMGILEEDMKLLEYQWFVDRYWYFRFLSPYGDILKEGETPYWHKSHPYSFKLYPFFNGEVHSFVSEFIDQQRYINRLITVQDFIMSAAAKGVLMFPEDCMPDNMTIEEIAEEWVSYNGVILYKAKQGVPAPNQIIANTSQTGIYDMLRIQLQLLEDVSGVSGALQGQKPNSGTPASLYAQQSQNSSINLIDIMESYRQLREDRDTKMMKLQQQYYTDIRYLNIVGGNYSEEAKIFDPEKVRNIEFDLSLTESTSTPSYRMLQNDILLQLYQTGAVTVEEMLENGAFPFADKLLQSIKSRNQQMQERQNQLAQLQEATQTQGEIIPEDIMTQVRSQSNPMLK